MGVTVNLGDPIVAAEGGSYKTGLPTGVSLLLSINSSTNLEFTLSLSFRLVPIPLLEI